MKQPNKISLSGLFDELQSQMLVSLANSKKISHHPGTKGDISEINWLNLLHEYLPKRYRAEKAFVVDVNGQISEQIDIVIFDAHYSPFLFKKDHILYVPAESVYAVFEAKPTLSKSTVVYAGKKAASVRILTRTSAPVPNIYGKADPKKPHRILAGILTFDCDWKDPFGNTFRKTLEGLTGDETLDIGCALQCGAFDIQYPPNSLTITTSLKEKALMHFFLKLLERLQAFGTVPALDFSEYIKKLK